MQNNQIINIAIPEVCRAAYTWSGALIVSKLARKGTPEIIGTDQLVVRGTETAIFTHTSYASFNSHTLTKVMSLKGRTYDH